LVSFRREVLFDFSTDPEVVNAIEAFAKSKTAHTALGTQVLALLRKYAHSGGILFSSRLLVPRYGESQDNLWGSHILVSENLRKDLGRTSIVLAHEGVHRVKNTRSFAEELACCFFQDEYRTELFSGITFDSPGDRKSIFAFVMPGSDPPGFFGDDMHQASQNGQLPDFLAFVPV
jgi:hypothetical protein